MTDIRVGDVRRLKNSTTKFVVKDIEYNDDSCFDWIYTTVEEGKTERIWRKTIDEVSILITNYNTWQEAVNSPEFRGDNND